MMLGKKVINDGLELGHIDVIQDTRHYEGLLKDLFMHGACLKKLKDGYLCRCLSNMIKDIVVMSG